ncbi:MAG: hypothetical protein HYV29_14585 [Ignavibacteriales bacterium]|nr:hypothetical protein [Ignavibacteriales bacterium]
MTMTELPHKFVDRHFSASPGKIGLLYGEKCIYPLSTLIAAEILKRSQSIVFIDGANRVDPYFLAKLARYQEIDPYNFLDRVYVTRAYTCYQLDISITDGLLDYVRLVDARIVIVYGLTDLFDDDQVPVSDITDILRRVRQTLVYLKANGVSVLLVSSYPRFHIKEREQFFKQMMLMTDIRYRLEQNDTLQRVILEEPHNGKNHTDRNNAHPVRRE